MQFHVANEIESVRKYKIGRDIATIQTNNDAECASYCLQEIFMRFSIHFIFSKHEHQSMWIFIFYEIILDFTTCYAKKYTYKIDGKLVI